MQIINLYPKNVFSLASLLYYDIKSFIFIIISIYKNFTINLKLLLFGVKKY